MAETELRRGYAAYYLLHAREPEQKKEIGSTCTPERNQDQQLHLTELKQQIQAILGSVDQVKAAYRGTSHERPTRSSYFTPGTKQWSFFPHDAHKRMVFVKNLLREERSTLRKGASGESIKSLLIRYELRALRHSDRDPQTDAWDVAFLAACSLPAEDPVSPEIFIINATFILLIHGVVFSTSKKFDYPPLVSNVGWLGLLSVARLGGQRALGCGGAIIAQFPNLMRHRVRTAGNRSMGGLRILLPPQGWLIVRSRLEDPWFWKAHESERYVECATDTR
ncbi:hypothetical protein CTI12_AA016550 (mitochondrion) [Artemisia annua]|uniref:Uncharacterized protein n=1 Tax=Artemisia annua TaxID=35608 RepID=A0A2U1QA68_ARTAN|nr:hypothetical protein CTI12_AA016550 [Artemisia annua]